jgi:hypothetical protein
MSGKPRERQLEDGLPGARFSNFFEIDNLKFRKNMKKIWDVDNDGLYMCAKNQHEFICILGCIKLTNFQIWDDEQ